MSRCKVNSPELQAEALRKHREGSSVRALAVWLGADHGIKISPTAVAKLLQRIKARRVDLAADAQVSARAAGPLLAEDLGAIEPDDELAALRRDLAAECRTAARTRETNWKRYHGALALWLRVLSLRTQSGEASSRAEDSDRQIVEPVTFTVITETVRRASLSRFGRTAGGRASVVVAGSRMRYEPDSEGDRCLRTKRDGYRFRRQRRIVMAETKAVGSMPRCCLRRDRCPAIRTCAPRSWRC